MLKHVFLTRLSPWCRFLALGKSQNALKRGRFNTKNGSKLGENRIFLKVIVGHLGGSNKGLWPVLSSRSRVLATGESQNASKMGHCETQTSEILSPFWYKRDE